MPHILIYIYIKSHRCYIGASEGSAKRFNRFKTGGLFQSRKRSGWIAPCLAQPWTFLLFDRR